MKAVSIACGNVFDRSICAIKYPGGARLQEPYIFDIVLIGGLSWFAVSKRIKIALGYVGDWGLFFWFRFCHKKFIWDFLVGNLIPGTA